MKPSNFYLLSLRTEYMAPHRLWSFPWILYSPQAFELLMGGSGARRINGILDYYGVITQCILLRGVDMVPESFAKETINILKKPGPRRYIRKTNRLLCEVLYLILSDVRFAQSAIRSLPEQDNVDIFERALMIGKPVAKDPNTALLLRLLDGEEVENLSLAELVELLKSPKEIARRLAHPTGLDILGRCVLGLFEYMRFLVSFAKLLESLEHSLLIRSILWYQYAPLFKARQRSMRQNSGVLLDTLIKSLEDTDNPDIDREQIREELQTVLRSIAFLLDETLGKELEDFLSDHSGGTHPESIPVSDNPFIDPDSKESDLEGSFVKNTERDKVSS